MVDEYFLMAFLLIEKLLLPATLVIKPIEDKGLVWILHICHPVIFVIQICLFIPSFNNNKLALVLMAYTNELRSVFH